ncbi:hypothetical protein E4U57_000554 [Claviceps arundinis]|uniref:Uncharacterized protein n=1 Tax=Claviceps arundinis TaxID=1623583 RepID=A0ABQ7PEJ9_9HYPO|nr:hypothetical protein E4U57_000554 [Claviceps arundinis]
MPPPKHSIHSEYERIDHRNFKCRHCAQHVKNCDHAPGATRVNTRALLSVHSSSTSIQPAENALGVGNRPKKAGAIRHPAVDGQHCRRRR